MSLRKGLLHDLITVMINGGIQLKNIKQF